MKILLLIPPTIPSYFNAGHHIPLFMVEAYLRKHTFHQIVACDFATLSGGWMDLGRVLIDGFDVVFIFVDFDGVDGLRRTMHYVNEISPTSKIVSFGRLPKFIPRFFLKQGVDAVVVGGDYETGIIEYVKGLKENNDKKQEVFVKGGFLPPEEWCLPDVRNVPYFSYRRMNSDDFNKYCGIPNRLELVVPIARGCPIGCQFCDVSIVDGKKDRRISVESAINYIKQQIQELSFEYISFYAPIFTLNSDWAHEFCFSYLESGIGLPWKCATTLHHIDKKLLKVMASSNCIRISVGVETLESSGVLDLPQKKFVEKRKLVEIATYCREIGIELNCFVMLAMPNGTLEGAKQTISLLRQQGVRVRPTLYTPYHLLNDEMGLEEVASFNRQLFDKASTKPSDWLEYMSLIFGREYDRRTSLEDVVKKIP